MFKLYIAVLLLIASGGYFRSKSLNERKDLAVRIEASRLEIKNSRCKISTRYCQ